MFPSVLPFLRSSFSRASSGMQRADFGSSLQPLLGSACQHTLSLGSPVLNLSVGRGLIKDTCPWLCRSWRWLLHKHWG